MANTTFKGPVRSENGFLEWNGSAWVPVQGGGGGGGGVLIVPIGGDETYTLNFTEVGQMITVVAQGAPGTEAGTIYLDATAPGNPVSLQFDGTIIDSLTTTLTGIGTNFPYTVGNLYGGGLFLQFVYTGTFETLYGPIAYFKVNGYTPSSSP